MTYAEGDLLLILRQNNIDIEYNLGPVTNLTGLANGAKQTITGWDASMALDAFGGSLADVTFVLSAVGHNGIYLTGGTPDQAPLSVTASKIRQLSGTLNLVGYDAAAASSSASGQAYQITSDNAASYDYIVTSGGSLDRTTWSGLTGFNVEQVAPGTNYFFCVSSSSATPKPAATQTGTFTLDENGTLTFIAGSQVQLPPITAPKLAVGISSGKVTVSFTTESGVNYRLRKSQSLSTPSSSWGIVGSPAQGDGSVATLQDSPSTPAFYVVEAYR